MNKNKNPLKKARFRGLRDSEGCITLSVIFRPYRKPIPKEGANIRSIISGVCFVILSISGPNIKYTTRANTAAPRNIPISIELLFFLISNRSAPHSSNLILFFKKWIKEGNPKDFAYFINSFCLLSKTGIYSRMRMSFAIMGIGIVTLIFGIIFYLQGNSIVGPTYSFMYSNPKWIVNGQWIAVSGVLILAAGLGISLRRPRS